MIQMSSFIKLCIRVEKKIFVFVFSRKFRENFLRKNEKNENFWGNFLKIFAKIQKNWIFSLKAGVYTYLRSLEKEFFLSFVYKFFTF
jgi:hypothetical protein